MKLPVGDVIPGIKRMHHRYFNQTKNPASGTIWNHIHNPRKADAERMGFYGIIGNQVELTEKERSRWRKESLQR